MTTMEKQTIEALRALRILDVADRLGIAYRNGHGANRMCRCIVHEDKTPSMTLRPATNTWKCYGCGKGGSVIDLVMEKEDMDFLRACEWLIGEFNVPVDQRENKKNLVKTIKDMIMDTENNIFLDTALVERFGKNTSNEFTRAMVQTGMLTPGQMHRAAERYRIGTHNDAVVFWQIDHEGKVHEGKVMHYQADGHRSHSVKPVSMSWVLKECGKLDKGWRGKNCMFGAHLIVRQSTSGDRSKDPIYAVVESEKTAMICSELLPCMGDGIEVVWLATGGASLFTYELLSPLRGKRIIAFPDTDELGDTYRLWVSEAKVIQRKLGCPVTVSDILERNATAEEKRRKIDIADYLAKPIGKS